MDLMKKGEVAMVKALAAMLFVMSATGGCSSLNAANDLDKAHQQHETLLWQQSEQIEKQRAHILQLQQQREQMQRQLVQLTLAVNNNLPAPSAPEALSQGESDKLEKPQKRVQVDATGKLILGQLEWAWFDLFGSSVKARLDTGAKSSALNASDIQMFERDGDGWVRFTVSSPWEEGGQVEERTFEAPLVRKVKVKNGSAEPMTRRPVVRLTTKVGSIVEDIEFVLQSKASGTFPVVLGRSFIRDIAIVDVAQQYTQVKHVRASRL